ncbi:MAG: Hsp70 family protein [Myxococcota bacterium]
MGIDLGTTFSTASYYDEGRVETLEINGSKLVPSVVWYPEDGSPAVVGKSAMHMTVQKPERVVSLIKREMGTENYRHPHTGKSAAEVSAEILKHLKSEAEQFLAEEVKDAVITIPAYFGEIERAHTREAGQLAGLNVVQLLPEPHAAALAYAVEQVANVEDKYLLVYDLGGGTFDVTVIHTTRKSGGDANVLDIRTVAKDGDSRCGGADWDQVLFELVSARLSEKYGHEVSQDKREAALVLENCEERKRNLSDLSSTIILGATALHEVEVSRKDFERNSKDLVFKTKVKLQSVLKEARASNPDIDSSGLTVLLAGGSTRMPMIPAMLEEVLGSPPLSYKNPDLLVSIGAAYWGHLVHGESVKSKKGGLVAVKPGGLMDLATQGVGVRVFTGGLSSDQEIIENVIPRGSAYDGEEFASGGLTTRSDNQTSVQLPIYEGNSTKVENCRFLASFQITGLPPRPAGQPITVYLSFDHDGVIRGRGVDDLTQKEVKITIDRNNIKAGGGARASG